VPVLCNEGDVEGGGGCTLMIERAGKLEQFDVRLSRCVVCLSVCCECIVCGCSLMYDWPGVRLCVCVVCA